MIRHYPLILMSLLLSWSFSAQAMWPTMPSGTVTFENVSSQVMTVTLENHLITRTLAPNQSFIIHRYPDFRFADTMRIQFVGGKPANIYPINIPEQYTLARDVKLFIAWNNVFMVVWGGYSKEITPQAQ